MFAAAALIVTFSGAAALAHQMLWVRAMVDALGAGVGTFARVTGASFLGLACGAWVASAFVPCRRWRAVGLCEAAVGILAAGVLLAASQPALASCPGWLAGVLERVLPFVLIVPPAFAMGLVLPWLLSAIRADGRKAAWLYAINTAGAVFGILAMLLFALPALGLRGAGLLAASVNIAIAVGCFVMDRRAGELARNVLQTPGTSMGGDAHLFAFGSGFLILGQEVLLQHQFAQVTINSLWSSAAVLAFVLLVLAASAAVCPLFVRLLSSRTRAFSVMCGLAAIGCAVQPLIFAWARPGLSQLDYDASVPSYVLSVIFLGAVVLVPSVFFAGLIFPYLLTEARGASRASGRLLAWNGLGGLVGAELSGAVIGPAFGLWTGMGFFACGYLLLFTLRGGRVPGAAVAVIVAAALLFTARLPQVRLKSSEELVDLKVGREGVVGVVQDGADNWRILFNNTYTLGGSRAQFNQERQAHLPILLHGRARDVAALGVATGSTIAGAALHSNVRRIDAIELSPHAADFAKSYFGRFNRDVLEDPRVHLIVGDARWIVARNPSSYDVVIGDLFLPWRTGEGRMFSVEHFQAVKRSLRPDGIFCQWLPLYQLTRAQYDLILRSFLSVFPDAFLIRGDFYRDRPIIGLVGGRPLDQIDWGQVGRACRELRGSTSDPLVRHPEGLAMLLAGTPPPPEPGPLNTLGNARLEWDAGRNVLGNPEGWFTGEAFLDELSAMSIELPDHLKPARDAGLVIARFSRGKIEAELPQAFRDDLSADWTRWPGSPKPFAPR